MLRSRDTDVVGDSSGRSYVTEQGHNVPLLRTSGLGPALGEGKKIKIYFASFGDFSGKIR